MKAKYALAIMDMAERFGQTSTATRLKVGSLLYKNDSIISLGVNGQPPNWPTEVCEEVLEDGTLQTLSTVRHSEDACLQKLWNSSETAKGATMFVSYCPCLQCSIKIVTAGVSKVYYRHQYRDRQGIDYLLTNSVQVEQI